MRVMVAAKPEGISLPDDVTNYKGYSGKFMWRLLKARIAMLLGR